MDEDVIAKWPEAKFRKWFAWWCIEHEAPPSDTDDEGD